jgi:hypothetical protein
MASKLIKKLNADSGQFSAVDVKDGTWSVDELRDRAVATAEEFVKKYQTDSMGDNDKAPTPGDKVKPTPAVVVKY